MRKDRTGWLGRGRKPWTTNIPSQIVSKTAFQTTFVVRIIKLALGRRLMTLVVGDRAHHFHGHVERS
jgi:hypothetical protein